MLRSSPLLLPFSSCLALRTLLIMLINSSARSSSSGSNFNAILRTPVQLRGLGEVASRYDTVLLDQFGVLHDGEKALPGAVNALEVLHVQGKRLVVVSNSSARASTALRRLRRMGFDYLTQAQVLTSGELAWRHLHTHHRGARCCLVTWRSHARDGYLEGLEMTVSCAEEADVLLLHGTQVIATAAAGRGGDQPSVDDAALDYMTSGAIDEQLRHVLAVAARRGIPVVCANNDLQAVLADGSVAFMPGGLRAHYEGVLGGERCTTFGKPLPAFFASALEMVHPACTPAATRLEERRRLMRTLHLGDSLLHDIAGAAASGVDSLLVTRHGVHRDRLHSGTATAQGGVETPLLIRTADLCDELNTPRPTFILEELHY